MDNHLFGRTTQVAILHISTTKFLCRVQDIRDEIVPILGLLQAAKSHLGARNVLLWVLEVLELDDTLAQFSCRRIERQLVPGYPRPT